MLTTQEIKKIIIKELPAILEEDPEIHQYFLQISRRHFADKSLTEDRFDRILDELKRDREEQNRKWDSQNQKWDEQNQKWDEQNRKWETNQKVINEMLSDVGALARKHDTTIGALGARWGLHTEQAFRNAMKGILEKFAKVEVLNITEYDDEGVVFGRPDQIELDIIIKNGILIIAEIKSSMSKPEMYIFERKVRYYEVRHQRKATEMIVISPMVAPNAIPVAEKLGIRIYSYADDVQL
jgi:hypothetical protein